MNPCNCTRFGTCELQKLLCLCSQGYHGERCEVLWLDSNPTAWYAVVWTLFGIGIVLIALSVFNIVLHYYFRSVVFPHVSIAVLGLVTCTLGGVFTLLTVSLDPYDFRTSTTFSVSYEVGINIINSLGYAFIACSVSNNTFKHLKFCNHSLQYGILTVQWLTVRETVVARWIRISFAVFVSFTLALAFVCPCLILVPVSFHDVIFYLYLAIVALFCAVVIIVTGLSTLTTLSRHAHNKSLLKRVAIHVTIVAFLLLCCIVVFLVVSFSQTGLFFLSVSIFCF
jgi:hypothetical protein